MNDSKDAVQFVTPRELEIQGQIHALTRELEAIREATRTDDLIAQSRERARLEMVAEDFVGTIANSPEFLHEIQCKETWLDAFAAKTHLSYLQYREVKEMITNAVWRGAIAMTIKAKLAE